MSDDDSQGHRLIEASKAEIIEQRTIDVREWIRVRTNTPEIFSIVKPDVASEQLDALRALARAVLDEDRSAPNGDDLGEID